MNTHLRIFISSTMDLKKERNAVNDVVNQIQGIPIRMEFFTARSQSPEEVCIEEVSKCDLYVGIFSKRYGFVPAENNTRGLSATVLEFEKARELNKPTLVFIQRNVDRDPELKQFVDTISDFKKGIFRKTFDSIDGLKYLVLASFVFHLVKMTSKAEEREKLEKLVMDESLYRRYVEKTCEYIDFKGIYQLRRVVQLKLDDIYVPLKLRGLIELQEQSLEIPDYEIREAQSLEIAVPSFLGTASLGIRGRQYRRPTTHALGTIKDGTEIREVISANKKMVILGRAGSGKTTILRHLAGILIRDTNSGLTPILVPLREYSRYLKSETNLSLLGYLKGYFSSHGLLLPEDFFERHLFSGGCIVMLDGLDEILEERDRISVASHIEEFGACFGEGNTIIISSRIPAYRTAQISGFSHYAIQKLDRNQISDFISRWFEIVEGVKQSGQGKRLALLVNHDANLLSLSMNPLMLSLICLVGVQGIPIPRKKADLYDICVRTLLSSWEAKKGFKGVLSEPQGFEVLKRLAFWFLKERRITVTKYEISAFIEQELEQGGLLEEVRQSQALGLLRNMVARAGILIEREPNVYGFVHLGLRDYLVALDLAGMDNVEEMFKSFVLPRLHSANYENVICLCSRCLAHQSISRALILLNGILNAKTPYEEHTHLDLVLAAKCLFNSGISYGELVREILEKLTLVLKSPSSDERRSVMEVFQEVDLELFEDFFSALIKELKADVAMDAIRTMAREGKILEEGRFSDIILKILYHEITTSSELSLVACSAVGYWAARGSTRALKLALEIIESGTKGAESCAEIVVPIARRDPKVLEKLLHIIDEKGSQLRRHLLLTLYEISPDKVVERATTISKNEDENQELRKAAEFILKRDKMTEEENESRAKAYTKNFINSLLDQENIAEITDAKAVRLIYFQIQSEQDLGEILGKLPKVFEANHVLAFRLLQLLDNSIEAYPSFVHEIRNFVKHLLETPTANKMLLAYVFAQIRILETEKHKMLLIELAEDKKEFVVARRSALNRLGDACIHSITKEDYARLLRLSSDGGINSNLFHVLQACDFDKNALMETMSEEIKGGHKSVIDPLYRLIRQSYE